MENQKDLFHYFSETAQLLARGRWKEISLQFDDARREFEAAWENVHKEYAQKPREAAIASRNLIVLQPSATALTLAMARSDSAELFGTFKRFLEFLLKQTERMPGYAAIAGIPHVQAGFLYMAASVMSLHWEAWDVFEKLLTAKFEWYYQSGRPNFSYPFDLPYFFHSEAFGRQASKIHDFYRTELAGPEIVTVTGIKGDQALDSYIQAQLLMTLKVVQLREHGESIAVWPDFGRFYAERTTRLLDRMYNDQHYSHGVLRPFGEDVQTFFSRLNERLRVIQSVFWRGSQYLYESVGSWEPRETHA